MLYCINCALIVITYQVLLDNESNSFLQTVDRGVNVMFSAVKLQVMMDKFAIGLSVVCAIHCVVIPILLVLLPSAAALGLSNEQFHFWMLVAVLPSSLLALFLGCKKHKCYRLIMLASVGLVLLVAAVFLSENVIGEAGE